MIVFNSQIYIYIYLVPFACSNVPCTQTLMVGGLTMNIRLMHKTSPPVTPIHAPVPLVLFVELSSFRGEGEGKK